ncbi:hypothetical protein Tco_0859634 [Tanacetum coccineum]|uniref:Transposase MuDR plant domain-containing protein n=1 Tax=Tanacetum coccineum TaxID=301880 RepID=A0ABQ5BFM8_9ASTR
MGDHIQDWYIRAEGECFDTIVYGDCPKSCHYAGRFPDTPNKKYVEGEIAFEDMVENAQFKLDLLNIVMNSLGYENDDEVFFYYKIPLKSLDIRLKPLVSESDISSFLGYVHKHKIMYVYIELVETTEATSDEDGEGDSENDSESEDGHSNANCIVDEERLVDEVEVNMTAFKFQVDGEGEASQVDPILPLVTLTEDDLEVLEYDSLESDQEDVPENARIIGLRKLRKKAISSGISNNFYVGKEFANSNLANERIRAYSVETRRNMKFKRNDKRRIRVICKGVVPTMTNKNVFVDKVEGTKDDILRKGKAVNEDAEKDKICCPWVLYFNEGDKAKYKGLKTKQKRYEEGSGGTRVVHLLVDLKYSSLAVSVSPRSIYKAVG